VDKYAAVLKKHIDILEEIFNISQVELNFSDAGITSIAVEHARGQKCQRSWKWREKLFDAGKFGMVSEESLIALKAKYGDAM
jgi:hypothetical protein